MRYTIIIAATFLAMLGLVSPSLSVAQEGGASATAATDPNPMEIARGAQAWAQECGRCHNIRSPSELSDEEWRVSVTHMRVRANIPADEARAIVTFLQASND